jgi:hypothetical protein
VAIIAGLVVTVVTVGIRRACGGCRALGITTSDQRRHHRAPRWSERRWAW